MAANAISEFFELSSRQTTITRELRGAIATFLTMAYILVVNPHILEAAGLKYSSAIACTAAAAGICCILMGVIANFPLATAPGMGLNAFVAFTLAAKAGSWQAAMGVIFLDGIIMLILVSIGLREAIMNAIPRDLRLATGAGIGLFIAFLGLVNARFVQMNIPDAPLTASPLNTPDAKIAIVGLVVTASLMAWKMRGAILLGIIAATGASFYFLQTKFVLHWEAPDFQNAFHLDLHAALQWKLVPALFAVLMVDFFDTLGTATAVGEQAGLVDADGRVQKIRQILIVDSLAASIGGLFGASSVTAYIESSSGVAEGARTGLHSVFVGLMFFAAIFAAPVFQMVPAAATAPALIVVGFLMIAQLARIDLTTIETAIPAFITFITIPLTYSIAHGIGFGFVLLVVMHILRGKPHKIAPLMYVVAAAFVLYFIGESGSDLLDKWIAKIHA